MGGSAADRLVAETAGFGSDREVRSRLLEISGLLIFLIGGVTMMAFGVMSLSFSFNMMVQEQKRHNKAMEQIVAEIRDRRP